MFHSLQPRTSVQQVQVGFDAHSTDLYNNNNNYVTKGNTFRGDNSQTANKQSNSTLQV